jgi:hypothetical protein
MDRKKAIKILKQRECCMECVTDCNCNECDKAFEMAIEALEQEPCEDCVSRQAVLNLFDKSAYYSWEMCLLKRKIEELPSVPPTRKKGEWVKFGQSFVNPNKFLCYSCSECGSGAGKAKTKFCPDCGARMEE